MHVGCALLFLTATVTAAFRHSKRVGFDPVAQHIDVSNAHAFIAPGASDLRGPCPAMNALANHGYIARNGYTNFLEALNAIVKVYGAGHDLAFFLSALGSVQAGDGNYFSIGGPPGKSLPVASGLLGQPRGISNAHNRFEGDGSPARGDLYQFGEAYLTQMPFFLGLYDLPGAGASNPNYDLNLMAENAVKRYEESVSQNPYYFRGFFGLTIPAGTHAFIFRMFANKSAAYPEGFLDRNTLKSFYAMTGTDDSNMVYTPGFERIPDNWYTRAIGDPYDVPLVDQDLTMLFAQNQELVAFGGNTGTVNSFTGLNVANLTGGLYNAQTLLQGDNLACFLLQSVAVAAPDMIRDAGVIADIRGAVAQINDAVTHAVVNLTCPELSKYEYDDSQLSIYPGYTKLKKDGTY